MRVVISSAPMSGNRWLKCLLRQIYDLQALHGREKPPTQPDAFRAWADTSFREGAIFHQHCRCSPALCDAIDAVPASSVSIVRDPYDVFLSYYYYWVQEQVRHRPDRGGQRPKDDLAGKALADPYVLSFLADQFGANLQRALGWLQGGRAVTVRYEGLKRDPLAELTVATNNLGPVPEATIVQAIETCRAENMRQMGKQKQWQVSDAQLGAEREGLNAAHLTIFRDQYTDLIRSLGYDVR
jgi:hypothetical protein